MTDLDAVTMLKEDEGFRDKPYRDTEGFLTIGYGWCLDKRPMRQDEAEYVLKNVVNEAIAELSAAISWFSGLDHVRQLVLINMRVNLGLGGLMEFALMLTALAHGYYDEAARQLLDSEAARQLPARYARLANMLKRGRTS